MKQGYCKAIPSFFFFFKVKARFSRCAPALSESHVSFLSSPQGIETPPVTGRASGASAGLRGWKSTNLYL